MKNVTKEIFLNATTCLSLGWLIRHQEVSPPTLSQRFRMEEGLEIGKRARSLYPDGTLVHEKSIQEDCNKTKSLMSDQKVSTVFEGTFVVDGYVAKADILRRDKKNWQLMEVKSSANDKDEFIDDMAYTAGVLQQAGIKVSDISVVLVSKDFRLGMSNEALFAHIDHTEEVRERLESFIPMWQQVKEATTAKSMPEPQLRFECGDCELFEECLGKDIVNHIFDIPRLGSKKFLELTDQGIVHIEDIPDGFPLTANQRRVVDCVQSNNIFVGKGLKHDLESILWPAYYLDFETVMTTIPLYPNIAPYTQIPTQYSIHKCDKPGHVIDHREYLADPKKDCREELARSLIKDLKGEGSIIAYSSFEKTTIKNLAETCPSLSEELISLTERIIDLNSVINNHFYHPDFHGSTSLKITLPVLVPELSYEGLEIADGDSASTAFAYLVLGKYEQSEADRVKKNLLEYCKQDTLAMVKLHEHLMQYV